MTACVSEPRLLPHNLLGLGFSSNTALQDRMRRTGAADKRFQSEIWDHLVPMYGGSAIAAARAATRALNAVMDAADAGEKRGPAIEYARLGAMADRQAQFAGRPIRAFLARTFNTRAWRQSQGICN